MSTAMNERKIIDRKYICDLAKEVGLTTLDLEALGENHHREIVVEGNLLERMIETQCQFECLAVIGDEECRGFYIEVPRQHQKIGVMQRTDCFGRIQQHGCISVGLACVQSDGNALVLCNLKKTRE